MSAKPEPKPAASLNGGLLARKGGARPAMRRQPIAMMPSAHALHEDLGWNDMGEEMAAPHAAAAAESPIHARLSAIAERITALAPGAQAAAKPAEGEKPKRAARVAKAKLPASEAPVAPKGRKAAFTLRLDADRHLRLRLLSAVSNRSAQQILVDALDALITDNDQLESLATQVEAKG